MRSGFEKDFQREKILRWIYLEGTSAIRRGMNEGEKKMKEKIENAVLRSLMNFEKDFEREKDFEMNLSGNWLMIYLDGTSAKRSRQEKEKSFPIVAVAR